MIVLPIAFQSASASPTWSDGMPSDVPVVWPDGSVSGSPSEAPADSPTPLPASVESGSASTATWATVEVSASDLWADHLEEPVTLGLGMLAVMTLAGVVTMFASLRR